MSWSGGWNDPEAPVTEARRRHGWALVNSSYGDGAVLDAFRVEAVLPSLCAAPLGLEGGPIRGDVVTAASPVAEPTDWHVYVCWRCGIEARAVRGGRCLDDAACAERARTWR